MEAPPKRQKKNSTKVNLVLSVLFHVLIILGLGIFAASQGVLGDKAKEFVVALAPKEPEKPPEKTPEPPKMEKPVEPPKDLPPLSQPDPTPAPSSAPPPAQVVPGPAAPAAAAAPDFNFSDGAKQVETGTLSPIEMYEGRIKSAFQLNWNRPEDMDDANFVAEVDVQVDKKGRVTGIKWLKKSGNKRWDKSVEEAVDRTASIDATPPKDFPSHFVVRFDVVAASEPLIQ